MTKSLLALLVALSLCTAGSTVSIAAEWGSLKGRLVFDGAAVTPGKVNVNKDVEFCGKHELVDESVTLGDGGGLSNAFVYLYVKKGKSVDVHPDLTEPSADKAVLDNKGCRFEPHAMIVRTGQTLEITNSDVGIGHNTNAQKFLANPKFNEQVSDSAPIIKVFEKSEPIPTQVECNVHPWMNAYVLVRDNPYMAVAGQDGSFEIKNLPAGKHEFIFWHEAKGNLKNLDLGVTKADRKGRAKLEIKAGETLDLGEVKVSAKVLGL
jgi:plastocyanin